MKKVFILLFLGLLISLPFAVYAQGVLFNAVNFCDYIKQLYQVGVRIAGPLAMAAILVGAVFYMASGGNPQRVALGKQIITGAVAGLLLVLTSWLIFNAIAPNLLVCKEPPKLEVSNIPTSTNTGDVCKGRQSFESKEACEKDSSKGTKRCVEGVGKKWCQTNCGQNLYQIAQKHQGKCLGACHCAWFVAQVLQESGCQFVDKNGNAYHPSSASGLAGTLKGWGWQEFSGKDGMKAGDVALKRGHIEIGAGNGRTLGSNVASKAGATKCGAPQCQKVHAKNIDTQNCQSCSRDPGHTPDQGKWCRKLENPKCAMPASSICYSTQCVKHKSAAGTINHYRPPGA